MAEQKKQEQDTNQLLKVRREKLAELQANGKDPFQITKFNQTHHSLEVKEIYEAHEAELLKDHKEPEVEGLDEEQKKEVLKKDYEERRSIMDANPIHVAVAGRDDVQESDGKASFCISRICREIFRYTWQEMPSEPIPTQILKNLILAIFSVWKDLLSEQEPVRFLSMQRK